MDSEVIYMKMIEKIIHHDHQGVQHCTAYCSRVHDTVYTMVFKLYPLLCLFTQQIHDI